MSWRRREITPVKVATQSCLAPSHFHLFLHLKKHLAGQKFHEDKEVKMKTLHGCVRKWQSAITLEYKTSYPG